RRGRTMSCTAAGGKMRGRNRCSPGRSANYFGFASSKQQNGATVSSPISESRFKVAGDQQTKEGPMATNLGGLVKGYLTTDVLQRAASFAGAPPAGTQNAVAAAVPAVMGALAEMGSSRTGAEQIVRMLDTGKFDGSALSNPAGFFAGSSGAPSVADA